MSLRWGLIPAAGRGTRIQPLAFSKELLPVGTRQDGGTERPRAVTEYLIERMMAAGVNRVCFIISAEKTDIVRYFGARIGEVPICYTVQQNPHGLCDALFSALPFLAPEDEVFVGLPDTIWFPIEGFQFLPDGEFSFLLSRSRGPSCSMQLLPITGAGWKRSKSSARTRPLNGYGAHLNLPAGISPSFINCGSSGTAPTNIWEPW